MGKEGKKSSGSKKKDYIIFVEEIREDTPQTLRVKRINEYVVRIEGSFCKDDTVFELKGKRQLKQLIKFLEGCL